VGAWSVTGINNGREAVVSLESGTTVTAAFTADGNVTGSGGCNDYHGPYTAKGQTLTIGPLGSTRKACEPAVMTQETQFFTALGKITTLDPSGPMIMLRDASGATQVVLTRP
jgi:heat shock protein HslJ